MRMLELVLLFAAVILGLVARTAMKRFVAHRLGQGSDALLEIDFWRASRGQAPARLLLAVELLSWATIVFLVVSIATRLLGVATK
jgi:hypothetical protein